MSHRSEPDTPSSGPRPPLPAPKGPPPRRRTRRWVRVPLICAAVLLTVAGGVLAAGVYLVHRYTSSVHQANLLGGAAVGATGSGTPTPASISGPINILLVGSDERAGNPSDGARSDSRTAPAALSCWR